MKRAKISYDAAMHGYTFFVTNWLMSCNCIKKNIESARYNPTTTTTFTPHPLPTTLQKRCIGSGTLKAAPQALAKLCSVCSKFVLCLSCYALRPCLIQTEVTFQLHRTWRGFFFCDPIYHMHTLCVCEKMVIYLGIKTPQSRKERKYTWQKNARISCSRNDWKYTYIVS